jgi:Isocitrate lyase
MLSLARLQRKFRLVESPYRTPQTLVGGPRLDAALMASSGGTAATKAMGKGSTQHQHLVQTEVPTKLLEQWLAMWTKHHQIPGPLCVGLRPHTAGSELLELTLSKHKRGKGRRHHLRRDRGSPGAQHPLGPGPEHLRHAPCARSA